MALNSLNFTNRSPEGLEHDRHWLLGHEARRMSADDIEELDRNEECLTARSDTESLDFGFGLSGSELKWLEAALTTVLTAEAKP
jgi:hypothetical protein